MRTPMERSIFQTPEPITSDSPLALPIDWNHLHAICDGDEQFELELLQTFVEDTQLHLLEVEVAIASEDFHKLEQQAHHIKGASANIGLTTMQAAAAELEHQARQQQFRNARQYLSRMEQSLAEVQIFLQSQDLEANR